MNEINVVIEALEKITSNTDSTYEWDDLMSVQFKDKKAEAVRQLCWQVSDAFPGKGAAMYSEEGRGLLRAILQALKNEQEGN